MLTKTRLFFERTTKMNTSLTALGSVYRNSKWADLKITNVQQNSLRQFFKLICIIVLFMWVLGLIYRTRILPCTDFIYETTHFYIELLRTWVIWVFYSFSYLLNKCTNYIRNLIFPAPLTSTDTQEASSHSSCSSIIKPTSEVSKVSSTPMITPNTQVSRNTNTEILTPTYMTTFYLQKVLKNLHIVSLDLTYKKEVSENIALNLYKVTPFISSIPNVLFISSMTHYNLSSVPSVLTTDLNTKFYHISSLDLPRHGITTAITNQWLSAASISHYFLINHMIEQNLRLGKEQKWLMKQTLLSSELSLNVNKYVQLQKSYGYPEWSLYSRDNNIWASLRFGDLGTSMAPQNAWSNLSYTKAPAYISNNTILNTAYIADSLFWLTKRFKYLQGSSTYWQKTDVYLQTSYQKGLRHTSSDASRILPDLNFCLLHDISGHASVNSPLARDFFTHLSTNKITSTNPKLIHIYFPLSL